MTDNSKMGMALVGGYLLGRTKKAKMAIGLGMALAGKQLNVSPQQLAKTVANSPVVGQLRAQVRKDLFDNTKSALTSAVTQRAGSIADSLHERTLDMNDPTRRTKRSEDTGAEEDGAERGEAEHKEHDERDEQRPRARKTTPASGRTAKSTRSAASANGKAASGRGSGAGARKSAAKTASSGTRKTTGGARKSAAKTASGGARKATNRGGGNG